MNVRVVKRENPFAQIDKTPINDDRLSPESLGVLVYLLSKHNNWKANKKEVLKRFQPKDKADGIKTTKNKIDSVFKELKSLGYCVVIPIQDEKTGKLIGSEYAIYEIPQDITEVPTSSEVGKSSEVKEIADPGKCQGVNNNEYFINNIEKEEKENFIQEIPDLKKRIGKPLFDALLKVAESEENLTRLESLNECKKFELLLQWLEYRNDRKKNLTAKGILILVTKFEQFENKAISVAIEKSIESNYTGLFIKPVQKQPVQQTNEPPKDANGNEIRYKPQGDLAGYAKILAMRDKAYAQKAAQ